MEFLRNKTKSTLKSNEEAHEDFFQDAWLATLEYAKFPDSPLTSQEIVDVYCMLREEEQQLKASAVCHEAVFSIIYSGLRNLNDELMFKHLQYPKELKDDKTTNHSFIEAYKKYKKTESESKTEKTPMDKFMEAVSSKKALSVLPEEIDDAALKIACYCYTMLVATCKSIEAVEKQLNNIDNYVDIQLFRKNSNFKLAQYGLPQNFIVGFGLAAKTLPEFRTIVYNSFILNKKAECASILRALAMTRLAKHGLPIYSFSLDIALQYFQDTNRLGSYDILAPLRTYVTPGIGETLGKFSEFIICYVMSKEDAAIALENITTKKYIGSEFWEIARILNENWLKCLGRKGNEEALNYLVALNKADGKFLDGYQASPTPEQTIQAKLVMQKLKGQKYRVTEYTDENFRFDDKALEGAKQELDRMEEKIDDIDDIE